MTKRKAALKNEQNTPTDAILGKASKKRKILSEL